MKSRWLSSMLLACLVALSWEALASTPQATAVPALSIIAAATEARTTASSLTFTPLTGVDRYGTAIVVSQEAYPNGAPAVVIATGKDFPDALIASPLATAYGGPVLLTPQWGLTSKIQAELARLRPRQVILIGFSSGAAAIETGVLQALPGVAVTQLAGTNRYETAVLVAEALRAKLGSVSEYVLVSGDKFPDALSVASLAAVKGWPILLTPQAGPLPDVTGSEIANLGAQRALVVGTNVAVPTATVDRLVGVDRYDTCALVAEYALTQGLSLAHIGVTTGENFPDALVAGPFLAKDSGILLLTRSTWIPAPILDLIYKHRAADPTAIGRWLPGDFRQVDLIGIRDPILGELREPLGALLPDAAEPDNTAKTAHAYRIGSGPVYGSTYPAHDQDWFVMSTVPGQSYVLTVTDESGPYFDTPAVFAQDMSRLPTSEADPVATPLQMKLGFVATTSRSYVSLTGGDLSGDGWQAPYLGFYGMQVDKVALALVYGRVTSTSGKPIAKAKVELEGATSGTSHLETYSDANGNYRAMGLLPGSYTASCLAVGFKHQFYDRNNWGEHADEGYGIGYAPVIPFELTGTSVKRIDFVLTPGPMEP